jgi:hypothetical protein
MNIRDASEVMIFFIFLTCLSLDYLPLRPPPPPLWLLLPPPLL